MTENKYVVQISTADVLCKSECGFYANAQWDGYCSKCYREKVVLVKRQADYDKNRSLLNFNEFEHKKHDRKSGTLRSFLRISPTRRDGRSPQSSSPSSATLPARQSRRSLSPDSQMARQKYLAFLSEVPRALATDLSAVATSTVERILQHHQTMGTDELAHEVQDVYERVRRVAAKHAVHGKTNRHSADECVEMTEEYITVRCYNQLFCAQAEEEAADLSLQHRVRSLHWVTAGFLEHGLDLGNMAVTDAMDNAFAHLIDMNARRTVSDKLACLVECSQQIFLALKTTRKGALASADEYLPVLIYSILRANPPQLQSNVKFVSRFALPHKVETGESGYYFTHLSCAMNFVQNMNADSLKMPSDEFEAYTSGRLLPPMVENKSTGHKMVHAFDDTLAEIAEIVVVQEALEKRIQAVKEKNTRDLTALLAEMVRFNEENPAVDPDDFPRVQRVTIDDVRRAQAESSSASEPSVVS